MHTSKVLAGRKIEPLPATERRQLEAAIVAVKTAAAGSVLVRKEQPLEHSTLLIAGLLARYVSDRCGLRQFVSLHVSGDLVDLHAYPMKQLDYDMVAVSESRIALLSHAAIRSITERDVELARKLWFASLLDAAIHREWIFRLGRLDAIGRVCHFFAETGARLAAVGEGSRTDFTLPMTQGELGEACGLTSIHVNSVLKALRDGGVCTFRDDRASASGVSGGVQARGG